MAPTEARAGAPCPCAVATPGGGRCLPPASASVSASPPSGRCTIRCGACPPEGRRSAGKGGRYDAAWTGQPFAGCRSGHGMADGSGGARSCATARGSTRCCWCGWTPRLLTRRPRRAPRMGSWPTRRSVPIPAARWSTGPPIAKFSNVRATTRNTTRRPVRGSLPDHRRAASRRCRCAITDGKLTVARPFIGRLGIQQM